MPRHETAGTIRSSLKGLGAANMRSILGTFVGINLDSLPKDIWRNSVFNGSDTKNAESVMPTFKSPLRNFASLLSLRI